MIILPTKGRPENLRRFVRCYNETCATLPIWVIFDACDAHRYNDVETPKHWKRACVPFQTPIGKIFNLVFEKYPNEPYYAMVADDVVPETAMWDTIMAELCQPDKIVWGCDDIQNDALPVHPFIGGDLVRALGWWAAPGLKHWFVDNVWKEITNHLQNGVYLPNVKMIHRHFINGRAPNDRTYQEQPDHAADQYHYNKFMRDEFPILIKRLKDVGVIKI